MSIDRRKFSALVVVIFLTALAFAEGTRTWEQSKFDELSKGTAKGVAIRSTGGLQLAPAFKQLYTTPSTYIWSIAADDAGNLYAATGAPARLYRITPDGQAAAIFEPQELQVQALVVDKAGAIYAATSPDGKVYKIEQKKVTTKRGEKANPEQGPTWSSSMYFDPGTKYIWDLALDEQGNLYIATGDHGEIYRVTPKGEHTVFFKSDEAHIRVLALDPKGNLIAGSDGSGLVYRISPTGQAFVLYSAPKKEITALAIDEAGNIYAAGVGEKRASALSSNIPAGTAFNAPMGGMQAQPLGGPTIPAGPIAFPAPGLGAGGGSEVYRIAPDGSPLRIWTSSTDLVYALAFDERGNLLAGTGNRGHIFSITGQDEFIDLIKAGATQVTAFAKAPGGGLYASTSNLGKLFLIGPALTSEGTYDSDIFDAHIFSRWGRAQFRGAGNVQLFARSGNVDNPDRNWSPWQPVDFQKDAVLNIPSARFIQWRGVLRAGNPAPRVDSVVINYLPKNVAPQIDDVTMQVGMRYPQIPKPPNLDPTIIMPPPAPVRDRDAISVKWTAHDDNDDQLVYSVYYRGDGESRWLLLKDGLTDKYYSFDAGLLPDGGYTIKVVASDAPSHSPGDALTSDKESARFEVDTTPPQIENLTAAMQGGQIHVTFRAADTFSAIKRAEYSLDAGDWQFIEPLDQISDDKTENYNFQVKLPDNGSDPTSQQVSAPRKSANPSAGDTDHVIVVRAYDRFDNMGTAKVLIRGR
ncbi:MAG TPA: hypothetical protein VEV41_01105 [Terriglobales bacterium]|nr:hypothetical protein [Terriglobales bacterium]